MLKDESYDEAGNLIANVGRTIQYDLESRPMVINNGNGQTDFEYDANGGRVRKIHNGVETIYFGKLYECTHPCAQGGNWTGAKTIFAGGATYAALNGGNIAQGVAMGALAGGLTAWGGVIGGENFDWLGQAAAGGAVL